MPQNEIQLYNISGFGKAKVDKYGKVILDEIARYCLKNRLDASLVGNTPARRISKSVTGNRKLTDTYLATLEHINDGLALDEIAIHRNLSLTTIENHVVALIENNRVALRSFVDEKIEKQIGEAIDKYGDEFLRPIKEGLPESITYGQIKMVIHDRKKRQAPKK